MGRNKPCFVSTVQMSLTNWRTRARDVSVVSAVKGALAIVAGYLSQIIKKKVTL